MGAKYSYVSQAHRRLQFQHANKKKNSNAAAQELAAQELVKALARIMTPAQMFQLLDIDESSLIEKWEVLRFLRREAAQTQHATTVALQSPQGLTEVQQQTSAEIMHKIRQVWLKLDKPASLPTLLAPPTHVQEKTVRITAMPPVQTNGSTNTGTGSNVAAPISTGGANSSVPNGPGTATAIPSLNLSKLTSTTGNANGVVSHAHSSSIAHSAALLNDANRDVATQLTREELVNLFREFTNDELDLLLRNALARAKILHPTLPSASVFNSRPSLTQSRFKDLFRWLFDSLDTSNIGYVTGEQLRAWLIGPGLGVGGKPVGNVDLLPRKLSTKIQAQVRVISNKLEEKRRYNKPEVEYMFLRFTYDELLDLSHELRLSSIADITAFQEDTRRFNALTRRVDSIAAATARSMERMEERRRVANLAQTLSNHANATAAVGGTTANGHHTSGGNGEGNTTGKSGIVSSASNSALMSGLLPSAAANGLDALSAGIAALLSDKDRRAAEESDRERREQLKATELKRKEEKESHEAEDRKRRTLNELELKRAEDRRTLVERDWRRDQQCTQTDRESYAERVHTLWQRTEGKLSSIELESLFKLQEQYHISRRLSCEIFAQLEIPLEKVNQQIVATIPDAEPLCANCLIQNGTHITRECGHICFCTSCATEVHAKPPHTRQCLVCKEAVSTLLPLQYQHWNR